jgi:hypothetical protein
MSAKYCYWSVADGRYGTMMEHCVRSARRCGVFKEFHVLTDRPLSGCECYDAFQCDKADGLFRLHYLKVGMSKLLFDYFIWLDADTVFVRNPVDVLACLGRAPIHVPLEVNLSAMMEDREWRGRSCFRLRDLYRQAGVINPVYLSQSAFWVVHREAIDDVCELAMQFVQMANTSNLAVGANEALGHAMQILCADPEPLRVATQPELWSSDDEGQFRETLPNGEPWRWRHPLNGGAAVTVRPAIVHLPGNKEFLAAAAQ